MRRGAASTAGRRPALRNSFFIFFRPEFMSGTANENIFQRRLADGDGFNLSGKGFHHVGDKTVAILLLQANLAGEYLRIQVEVGANTLR